MVGPAQQSAVSALEDAVVSVIADHGGLTPGEVVTHFDLVCETRCVDSEGCEHIRRHHWSPRGSTPHLSVGLLAAQTRRLLDQL